MAGYYVKDSREITLGPLKRTLARGTVLYPSDLLAMSVIQENLGRRPIVWATTAGRGFAGLGDYVVQRGLGFELLPARPDTTSRDLDLQRLGGVPLDVPTTTRLVFETYRYAGLVERGAVGLESTSSSVAATLGFPPALLVYSYLQRGDRPRMDRALGLAARLSPNPDFGRALRAAVDSAAMDTGPPRR
jgi:hypothetical protein